MNKIKIKPAEIPSYFYDGSILLAEKIGSQVQKIYINDGQGIIGMVRPIYEGSNLTHYQRLYYLYDSLGSVSAVTGEHGLPLTGYKYTPYGTCMNVSNDPINNLQFIGRYGGYLDIDTGLTYFWHRWYDSSVGRWISRDPLQENQNTRKKCKLNLASINDKNTIDLYHYTYNRPNYFIDYKGLDCASDYAQCLSDVRNEAVAAEIIITTGYILCLGGCGVACAETGIVAPLCFSECAGLCTEGYEYASIAATAWGYGQAAACYNTYKNCKDNKCKK